MLCTLIIKMTEDEGASTEGGSNDSTLGLSAAFLYLGEENAAKCVRLTWNFTNTVNLIDWIGMFHIDQCNPLLYMDYKNYGVCGSKSGSVNWRITGSHIPLNNKHNISDMDNDNEDLRDSNNNRTSLCFKYYDGITGALRATSPPLLVYADAQIAITSVVCKELSKIKNLAYYAKITCSGTETCNYRTSYSTEACWNNLNFLFPADRSAELKFAIKERHWSVDRTLGLVNIPIIDLVQRSSQSVAFVLRPPNQSNRSNLASSANCLNNNNEHCQIVVSCRLMPQQRQSYTVLLLSGLFFLAPMSKESNDNYHELQHTFASDKIGKSDTMHSLHPSTEVNNLSSSSTARCSAQQPSVHTNLKSTKELYTNVANLSQSFDINCRIKSSATLNSVGSSLNNNHSMCSLTPSSSNSLHQQQQKRSANLSNGETSRLTSLTHLPQGWEVRVDRHGRLIYLDHINKRTTWHSPIVLDISAQDDNKRYISARRTIISKNIHYEENVDDLLNYDDGNKKRSKKVIDKTVNRRKNDGTSLVTSISLEKSMAVRFLQRNDFLTLLQQNQEALSKYNESVYLKHIVHRIRRDATKFPMFERNRELVEFLNLFADKTQPLPFGWQSAKHYGDGVHQLFIDHKMRKITPIDPRLPLVFVSTPSNRRRVRSAPPARRQVPTQNDLNGNMMWNVLNRVDEIQALVQEHYPELAQKVCKKLHLISRIGEAALMRFANDVDLIAAISILDQKPSRPPTNEFEEKLNYFYTSLQRGGYGQGPGKIRFRLRRTHLMNDAFDKILAVDSSHLKKYHMTVTFSEEDGLDYGGPSRELFFLLSRELFNPYYGLFEYSANDTYTVQISPISKFVDNYLEWMELSGRILGLALIHHCMIDTFFTRAFYKMLLRIPYTISDLQAMDSQFHNSLLWIRENRVTDDLDLTFSVTEELAGEIIEKELLPDGKTILVTESNKEDYIQLMLKWRMERNVEPQSQALLRGLYSIIDREYLRIFDGEQLELVLSGTVDIDIEDWRENTEYKGGYHEMHVVVNWFWQTVYAMCNADRLKLLQFVTGTSSVPYEGFKALRGSDGPKKFTIEKWGEEDSLPRAHTCFNRLDLPCYQTQNILLAKLKIAIYESSCYAIE